MKLCFPELWSVMSTTGCAKRRLIWFPIAEIRAREGRNNPTSRHSVCWFLHWYKGNCQKQRKISVFENKYGFLPTESHGAEADCLTLFEQQQHWETHGWNGYKKANTSSTCVQRCGLTELCNITEKVFENLTPPKKKNTFFFWKNEKFSEWSNLPRKLIRKSFWKF